MITKELVMELNMELAAKGCPFRYEYRNYPPTPDMRITLTSMNGVDSFIINVTSEFFEWLEMWLKLKLPGFKPKCNNTGNIIWVVREER